MTTTQAEQSTTDLDVTTRAVVDRINSGALSMADLLKALSPKPTALPAPEHMPVSAVIPDEDRKAIERVLEVFGKVVPTERRVLQPAEVDALIEEKQVLDRLKKMSERRLSEGIRPAIFNHLDVEVEEGSPEEAAATDRDKDGHYLREGEAVGTGSTGVKYTREIRTSSPTLDIEALKALSEDPDYPDFTHADYLSMTEQVRVVEESKVLLALKKNPNLIHAIAKATRPGSKSASLYLRKA